MRYLVVLLLGLLALSACGDEEDVQPEVPSWAKVAPEQIAEAKKHGVPVAFENEIGMRFVLIPAGTFLMGSPEKEDGHHRMYEPQHEVTVPNPFYLATTETTQAVWTAVMEENPSEEKGCRLPVANVGWMDCREFVQRVRVIDPRGRYRLPTEAEWEYACRAGTTTRYAFGDAIPTDGANYVGLRTALLGITEGVRWYAPAPVVEVGTLGRNAWGLYEMHGNVCEWCRRRNAGEHLTGPVPTTGGNHERPPFGIRRGGAFWSHPDGTRSAARSTTIQTVPFRGYGFRLLAPLPEPKSSE